VVFTSRPRLNPPESQIQSLDRALSAFELFTATRSAIGLTEAATALRVGKSTIHRLFSTLVARGYLSYDPRTRDYRLGLAVIRIGNLALASLDLRRVAMSHLKRLADETEESAFLLVVSGDSAVVLDWVESKQPLRMALQPGLPWPLHAGASNKVLLAHLPPERIASYIDGPLQKITNQTPGDRLLLIQDLDLIRAQGYAWSVGELTPDVGAFAVPILDRDDLLGGIAVAGPASRIGAKEQVVSNLQHAAREIARELGARA
jgi:IclR family acetate operon transcriptional repressor